MTNDNRQTEMLESEIMFSLLKKFLEVKFFFQKMYKDKTVFFNLGFNATPRTNISLYQNKQKDGAIFLN